MCIRDSSMNSSFRDAGYFNIYAGVSHDTVSYTHLFGDTARTPYGSKAVSTVRKYTEQITDFLVSKDVKMLVITCNTISSTCLDMLRERFPQLPVIGIIQPAAQKVALICNEENSIGVIATKVTINSGAYQKAIKDLVPQCNVAAKAAPAFVPLIEEGIIDNEIMDLTIHYLSLIHI